MAWRVAKSLDVLLRQVNEAWPARDKSSDGSIGDESHAARFSDHNPDANGVVCARDFTNDPAHGLNSEVLANSLLASKDRRIKYVISNRKIASGTEQSNPAWVWRPYSGANPHDHHCHVSVKDVPALYDDMTPWRLGVVIPAAPPSTRQTGITATVFGGASDPNNSAYTGKPLNDTDLYVALPFRFSSPRPVVRVITAKGTQIASIEDIGPWNTNDPYWQTGKRPQAESGTDMRGRRTNKAGIDLSPALAKKLGIDGKGMVSWEFVDQAVQVATPITPAPPKDWRDFDIWGWFKSLFTRSKT